MVCSEEGDTLINICTMANDSTSDHYVKYRMLMIVEYVLFWTCTSE